MKEKQRILVVDDDENIAELIGLYLNKECFETKLVYDGEQALKAVKDFAPNLVLLDIMLPGMDGLELLSKLKASPKNRDIPVIMLTATKYFERFAAAVPFLSLCCLPKEKHLTAFWDWNLGQMITL